MSEPKLPKGLPVESFDPGDLVYTAKDMEDMHAQGVREGRAAAFDACIALALRHAQASKRTDDAASALRLLVTNLRARAESEAGHG